MNRREFFKETAKKLLPFNGAVTSIYLKQSNIRAIGQCINACYMSCVNQCAAFCGNVCNQGMRRCAIQTVKEVAIQGVKLHV